MTSTPAVFELMIHRAKADADAASRLQRKLRRDGVRAGVADLLAADATRTARRSVCFIGAAFAERDFSEVTSDRFDLVYANGDAGAGLVSGERCTSYDSLLQRLAHGCAGSPISARALRDETRASYDAIAIQFSDIWCDAVPGDALEPLLARLPSRARVLDAGCGPGHHASYFKRAGFDPVGLDCSRSMLEIAAAKNRQIPFVHTDILSPTLPKGRFDAVWCAVALNHIPREELPLALQNLVGAVKCNGLVGLNFQIGRSSEIVSRENDHRFFEYPLDTTEIAGHLARLGVEVVANHFGVTTRNTHGLELELRFATVVARKRAE